jgi:prophage regulatory protein
MEPNDVVIRLPQVMELLGLSRSSIYAMVAAGRLPAPIAIGLRARGWLKSEVTDFIRQRAAARAAPPTKSEGAADAARAS